MKAAMLYHKLLLYKCASTFAQFYLLYLVTTNGSSETPFISLPMIAHMGALAGGLRAIDAVLEVPFKAIDPFQKHTPEELRQIAKETT